MRVSCTGMRRVLLIPAVGVLLFAGCSSPAPEPSVVPSPTVDYSGLPAEFPGNGSFVAGVDIQPGTYLVVEEHASCEWFLGDEAGKLVASGANDVVVDAGETVEVSGCAVFELAG